MPHSPEQPAHARELFPAHFNFSQRNGCEPLPGPMRLEHLSDDLRREVWDEVYVFIKGTSTQDSRGCIERNSSDKEYLIISILATILKLPKDDIQINYDDFINRFKEIILKEKFDRVLNCIEIITDKSFDAKSNEFSVDETPFEITFDEVETYFFESESGIFTKKIAALFDKHRAAYWLNNSQYPYCFFPRASQEQGEAVQKAIETVHQGKMDGASIHLRKAAKRMNEREYADSIRESIHAVVSAARKIDPAANKKLAPALNSLEKAGVLKHKALKQGFASLYGYTSNTEGIRHPLLDSSSADNVGIDEAIFMYGACASFVAYLTRKHQSRRDAPIE